MESLDTAAILMEDLLDFSSDIGEEEQDEEDDDVEERENKTHFSKRRRPCSSSNNTTTTTTTSNSPFLVTEFVEEELEWISNKDAFPMVESFVDIMPNHPSIATTTTTANHQSPVSVLENSSSNNMNSTSSAASQGCSSGGSSGHRTAISALTSSFKVPGKARSKYGRKRRRDMFGEQWQLWAQQQHDKVKANSKGFGSKPSSTIGRKCLHCQAEKTPQWRAGPLGPKTLCNACGVRYKSGRLVPEYRPASSPTFSSDLHSNSHRKIVEMRRQKMPGDMGMGIGMGVMKNAEIG